METVCHLSQRSSKLRSAFPEHTLSFDVAEVPRHFRQVLPREHHLLVDDHGAWVEVHRRFGVVLVLLEAFLVSYVVMVQYQCVGQSAHGVFFELQELLLASPESAVGQRVVVLVGLARCHVHRAQVYTR